MERRRAGRSHGGVASQPGAAVQRAGRRGTDGVPHRLADHAGGGLLRETTDTVESIARRVGYANAFALSVAFKRVRGTSPTAHRRSATAA